MLILYSGFVKSVKPLLLFEGTAQYRDIAELLQI